MNSHKQLTREDRVHIELWHGKGISIVHIAERLCVHRTTIYRELKRSPENLIYDADSAQLDATRKKTACGAKSKLTTALKYQIECDLEDSWSPEQISMARGNVSFKTIYNWLYAGYLRQSIECLRHKGKQRKRQTERRGKMVVGHTIDQRPEIINSRKEFGHWELDTVVSGRDTSKACDATFLERKTRFYWTVPMLDRTAASMTEAIKLFSAMLSNPKALLSLTVDRGKEFACWPIIKKELAIPMYFCDPHAPWQRGSGENGNGLYREIFPKGIDFSTVSDTDRFIALWKINHRPKKTLGWENCFEAFQKEMLHLI